MFVARDLNRKTTIFFDFWGIICFRLLFTYSIPVNGFENHFHQNSGRGHFLIIDLYYTVSKYMLTERV